MFTSLKLTGESRPNQLGYSFQFWRFPAGGRLRAAGTGLTKRGETLWYVAMLCGTSVDVLRALNRVQWPNAPPVGTGWCCHEMAGNTTDGTRICLPAPVSATVSAMKIRRQINTQQFFRWSGPLVYNQGLRAQGRFRGTSFELEGIVDSREWVRSPSGCLLRVSARSRAALLAGQSRRYRETFGRPSLEKAV